MSDPSYRLVFDATQKYGDRTALAIGFTLAVLVAFVVGAMFVVHAVRRVTIAGFYPGSALPRSCWCCSGSSALR